MGIRPRHTDERAGPELDWGHHLLRWVPGLLLASSMALPVQASTDATFIRPPATCPERLEPLMALLLRDVPDYGNRVSQRSRRSERSFMPQTHIVTASPGNIALLDPRLYDLLPTVADLEANGLESIFFTTLEKQYLQNDLVFLQHYHWAFLARTSEGWRLSLMYSRLSDYPSTLPPTPPQSTNHGVIAQAIRLWLRDCEAGAIEPPTP